MGKNRGIEHVDHAGKMWVRQWVAELCGISPGYASKLFSSWGYDPARVSSWLLKGGRKRAKRGLK